MESCESYKPLVCNANIYGHIRYEQPVVCHGPDFRTSYYVGHANIKPIHQEFERIKRKLPQELTERSIDVRDDNRITTYKDNYTAKHWDADQKIYPVAKNNRELVFQVPIKERLFRRPPRPIPFALSSMKRDFQQPAPIANNFRDVCPPDPYSYCEVSALGRDEQPPWRPEQPGYSKLLDPYMTTARLTHVPFSKQQQDGIARKDIITYYDAAGYPKVMGFGPKVSPKLGPMFPSRREPVYDILKFKKRATIRIIPKTLPRVPHKGMQSESQAQYRPPTTSDFYTQIFNPGVEYGGSLPEPSPYQNLAPPGMYDTESCHLGTGWPIRAVVDPGGSTEGVTRFGRRGKRFVHDACCVKVQ